MIEARRDQHLTQQQLADRTGIDRADISKLENGNANPSLKLLKRLAEGLGMNVKIEFVPKQTYSESNMHYLEKKMEDYKAGRLNLVEHELIEE